MARLELAGALCAQVDSELFFPEPGGSPLPAKSVCLACPERIACLEYALGFDEGIGELTGIWGGTTAMQRREIRRTRQAAA